jgi:hypothetical protein
VVLQHQLSCFAASTRVVHALMEVDSVQAGISDNATPTVLVVRLSDHVELDQHAITPRWAHHAVRSGKLFDSSHQVKFRDTNSALQFTSCCLQMLKSVKVVELSNLECTVLKLIGFSKLWLFSTC